MQGYGSVRCKTLAFVSAGGAEGARRGGSGGGTGRRSRFRPGQGGPARSEPHALHTCTLSSAHRLRPVPGSHTPVTSPHALTTRHTRTGHIHLCTTHTRLLCSSSPRTQSTLSLCMHTLHAAQSSTVCVVSGTAHAPVSLSLHPSCALAAWPCCPRGCVQWTHRTVDAAAALDPPAHPPRLPRPGRRLAHRARARTALHLSISRPPSHRCV